MNKEQYWAATVPSVHNVCAEHNVKLNSPHLPVHDPYPPIPCTSMCLFKSLLNATSTSILFTMLGNEFQAPTSV